MTLAVVDTTLLSNFAHIRQPQLLLSAFPNTLVPEAVLVELARGEQSGKVPLCDWGSLQIAALNTRETALSESLRQRLDAGEAACIAIALSRGAQLLTDDRAARQMGVAHGLRVTGTLGALVKLVRQQVLAAGEADRLLAEMMACGYRSPATSIHRFLPKD